MATANEHKQTERTGAKGYGGGSEGTWANDLVGFFTTTLGGRLLDCNQVLADMLGYSQPSEMMEMAVGSFYFNPTERQDFIDELERSKQLKNREIVLKHRNGRAVHVLENARMVEPADRPKEIHGIVIDISSIRGDEMEQRMLVNNYRQLLGRVRDGILVVRSATVLYANQAAESLFGGAVIGVDVREMFTNDGVSRLRSLIASIEEADPTLPHQVEMTAVDGSRKPLLLYATATWHAGALAAQFTLHDPAAGHKILQERLRIKMTEESNRALQAEVEEHKRTQLALLESRHMAKSVVDSSLDMIMASDNAGSVTEFNPAAVLKFGYEREDVLGKSARRFFAKEEDQHRINRELERYGSFSGEVRNVDSEGREFTSFLNASRLIDAEGRSLGTMGVSRDVTQARKDHEALRASEERYRVLFDNATDLIHSVDISGKLLFVNAAWEKAMGYTRDEAVKMNMLDMLPADYRALAERWLANVEHEPHNAPWRSVFLTKDQRKLTMEGSSSLYFENDKVVAVRGILRDVTAATEAQERLHKLTAKERALFQSNEHLFWTVDSRIALTSFNNGYERMVLRMHGHAPELNTDPSKPRTLFAEPDYHKFWEEKYAIAFSGQTVRFETDRSDAKGQRVCNEIYLSPILAPDGTVSEVFGIGHEVTGERLAEDEVREQSARLKAIFEGSADLLIWTCGQSLDITSCNTRFTQIAKRMFKGSSALGENLSNGLLKHVASGQADAFRKQLAAALAGRVQSVELCVSAPRSKPLWLEVFISPIETSGRVVEVSCMAHDITDKKSSERAMLESIREKEVLLKEIHHRVKNNLQIISSIFSLQRDHLGNDPRSMELMHESQNRIRSMAFIHESLYQSKNFSHIDLADYMGGLCRNLVMSYSLTDKVALRTELKPLPLDIDKAIPCGLILNELVSNALKHAFPIGHGEILLELEEKEGQVQIVVQDNGCGFPSKGKVRRGLGLELVEMLTEQLDGHISRTNGADNTGTRYLITFDRT